MAFQNQGMDKKYYRMEESNRSQFTGNKMNYHIWKGRFRATVHSQRRLISVKEKALATAMDKRRRLMRNKVLVLKHDSPDRTDFSLPMSGPVKVRRSHDKK
jgi:hypothetical protein